MCFQMPHLSQQQEIMQMVLVCNVLPSLNVSTKNTLLECKAWHQRQVGAPGFVATLRDCFDIRGQAIHNLKSARCCSSVLLFYFLLIEFSGDFSRGSKSRQEGDLRALFQGSLGIVF